MIRKTLLVLSSIALFASCDNDLQIIADWKDVPVVYGILNAEDSVHYIKLNKAFLGRGDVMMMAQEFDSLHYAGEDVGLRLLEQEKAWIPSENGEGWLTISTIELEPTDEFDNKPEGAFSSPTQIIYKSDTEINADALYAAEVYRISSDTLIAYTKNPIAILSPVNITRPNSFSPLTITPNGFVPNVEWKSIAGGDMYELSMNFNYMEFPNSIEFPESGEADTISLEFNFQSRLSNNSEGGEKMTQSIDFEQFLNFIATISEDPDYDPSLRRLVVGMEAAQVVSGFAITHACLNFTLLAAGEDLSTYLVLNENSSSLVLDRPEYSNIENGIGILSSRTSDIVESVKITNSSNDEIATNDVTKHLNFGQFKFIGEEEIEISYGN